LLVLNSTFVGNHALSGGAMYLGGNTVIAYSTFIGNTATTANGAIFVPGTLAMLSSVLAGNTAPLRAEPIGSQPDVARPQPDRQRRRFELGRRDRRPDQCRCPVRSRRTREQRRPDAARRAAAAIARAMPAVS
jgi:hypothetical protein